MKKPFDFDLQKLYPQPSKRTICVFCSSSKKLDEVYKNAAELLGKELAIRGYSLVHGGGKIGLMGVLSAAVQKNGGKVTGILPESLNLEGIASETDDEIIITKDMPDRKAEMRKRSDAFIILPGGFGTLEEFFETVTLKQLNYTQKPLVVLNINHYYDELLHFLDKSISLNFISEHHKQLYYIVDNVNDAMLYIENQLNEE
jgi:hypothetical protein